MERKSPHEPTFEPDVISLLDFLNKWLRERFFGQIRGGGGLYRLAVFSFLLAYWYPY